MKEKDSYKELEIALIDEEIDLAVHSLKDMETKQSNELLIAAVPLRENPCDTLLINYSSGQIPGLKHN